MRVPFRSSSNSITADQAVQPIDRPGNYATTSAQRGQPAPDYVGHVIAASDVLLHNDHPAQGQAVTAVRNLITIAEQQPEQRRIAHNALQAYLRSPQAVEAHLPPGTESAAPRRHLTAAAQQALEHLAADPRVLHPNLRGVNWSDVDVDGGSLRGADLTDANLDRANLVPHSPDAQLDLTRARLVGASLQGARLDGAQLYEADLTGADLTGAVLTGATLDRATATRADLTAANLRGVHAVAAQLRGADLTEANLQDASLVFSNLHKANLTNANLHYADLSGSELTPEQVPGSELASARLAGTGLEQTFLPPAIRERVALNGAPEVPDDLDRTYVAKRAPNLLHDLDTAANQDQVLAARQALTEWAYHYSQSTYSTHIYGAERTASSPHDAIVDNLEAAAGAGKSLPQPDPWTAAPSTSDVASAERAPDFWRFPQPLDQAVATTHARATGPAAAAAPQILPGPSLGQSELGR